ncbi:MAG: M20 family metallopeptidase [Pirellulaceae bacterium]|nr:M20 family metallopeptidase [Pirellulaceae bacterium]
MVQMLTRCVLLESPSADPASQTGLFELFTDELRQLGFRCRRLAGTKTGGQLLAIPADRKKRSPAQLLLGHCDTVWPHGTLEKMPVVSRDGCLHGPGAYDMKAGLVQAIYALRALRELHFEPSVTPVFFINSDEEIGSPESAKQIHRIAPLMDRVFVMEPSLGPSGQLKTSRKGVGRFIVTVIGKAAHAGLDPDKGISSILELSHVVQTLFAMNDPEHGVSVNVGTIDGGMRPNVVAPESRAEVDVRVRTQKDADRIEQAILSIQPTVPGTQLQISGHVGRPPLEPTPRNRKLWQRAVEAAQWLEIPIDEGTAGGGSDGNWTSLYAPTLDGLGAVGDGAHALTEHVVEAKMPERSALLACLLLGAPIADAQTQTHVDADAQTGDCADVNVSRAASDGTI